MKITNLEKDMVEKSMAIYGVIESIELNGFTIGALETLPEAVGALMAASIIAKG